MKRILGVSCVLACLAFGATGASATQAIDECYVDGVKAAACNIDTVLPANYGSYVTFTFGKQDDSEDEVTFFFWQSHDGKDMWRVYTRKLPDDSLDYVEETPDTFGEWRIETRGGRKYLHLRNGSRGDAFVLSLPLLPTVPGSQ